MKNWGSNKFRRNGPKEIKVSSYEEVSKITSWVQSKAKPGKGVKYFEHIEKSSSLVSLKIYESPKITSQ